MEKGSERVKGCKIAMVAMVTEQPISNGNRIIKVAGCKFENGK
jgi:hypothetical protein